jgi:Amt family ammonium transporter
VYSYAFAFGGQNDSKTDTTFIGTTDFFTTNPLSALWFFKFTFSTTLVTIVIGMLAEWCQMAAYMYYSLVLADIVYPVVAQNVWSNNRFMSQTNTSPLFNSMSIDFAGSSGVHLTGGTLSLFATLIL